MLIIVVLVIGGAIRIVCMTIVPSASRLVMVHMSVTFVMLVTSAVIACHRMKVFGVCTARCGVIPFVRICVKIAVISMSFVGVIVYGC